MSRPALAVILLLLSGFAATGYAEPNKVQYELQERCAKRASEFFQKEYGNGIEDNGGGGQNYTYFVNHYNARLNKCFISWTRYFFLPKGDPPNSIRKERSVVDVNERREYGYFEKFNEGAPGCRVEGKLCHVDSESEWEALIKPYMDDAEFP
jgi:hypothetical protein